MNRTNLLVSGPDPSLLETREPEVVGADTLGDTAAEIRSYWEGRGIEVEAFASNVEGAPTGRLHQARERVDGLAFNPGALTHADA